MPLKIYFCHIAKRLHNNSAYRKENRTRHQIQHFKKTNTLNKDIRFQTTYAMFDLLFKTPERSMLVHGSVKRPKEPDLSRHLKLWTDKRILSNIQNLLRGGFGVMGCTFWRLDKTLFSPWPYYHTIQWNSPQEFL